MSNASTHALDPAADLATNAAQAPPASDVLGGSAPSLSPDLLEWISDYSEVGERDPYLWRWCRQAVEITTLSCVPPERRERLGDTKTLGVMFDVLLDDVADRNGSDELLDLLLELPLGARPTQRDGLTDEEAAYGAFATRLWREITSRARELPRYDEFAEVLRFDYLQLCNVMRYSRLVNNDLDLLNMTEHDLYSPHNMHIMICSTFDLMASPSFDRRELGGVREVAWRAQCMGRIGNLITTWERELGEGDFSSGVFAQALSDGDVSVDDLRAPDRAKLRRAIVQGDYEARFADLWRGHREWLHARRDRLRSVDVGALARGLEQLFAMHMASRGRK